MPSGIQVCCLSRALICFLRSLCRSLTSVLNPDPSPSELPSSQELLDEDGVPVTSAAEGRYTGP